METATPTLKRIMRKLGRDAAARGRPVDWALMLGTSALQRQYIRQGHDTYMARHSDRRA